MPRKGEDRQAKNKPWDFYMELSDFKKALPIPFFPHKQAEEFVTDL